MNLQSYPDSEMLHLKLADLLAAELGGFLRRHDRIALALPDDPALLPICEVLAALALDWQRVTLVATETPWPVPCAGLAPTLEAGPAAAATRLALTAPEPTPEAALPALQAALAPHLPLAMGLVQLHPDGGLGGLRPGAAGLAEALAEGAPPVAVLRGPSAPGCWLALTGPVLRGATSLHVLAGGAAGRAALRDAPAPLQALLAEATVHWAP